MNFHWSEAIKPFAVGMALLLSLAYARAHTMSATECHTFAWDAKQVANDRAVATEKMQLAMLATTLETCHDAAHALTCIYKDAEDDNQATNALNWIYANGSLSPQQIHDTIEQDCDARRALEKKY